MVEIEVIIFGCGLLGGVLRIGGIWGDCDLLNLKNCCCWCLILIICCDGDGEICILIDILLDMCE